MTPDPNDLLPKTEQPWNASNFGTFSNTNNGGQTTPEDPVLAPSNGGIPSPMAAAAAATSPLCSKMDLQPVVAAGGGLPLAADFSIPMGFYPGQWLPNIGGSFIMDDQSWAAMNYNPFAGGQATLHPFDPFPSTSMAGNSGMIPSTSAASIDTSLPYPFYGMMAQNPGFWPMGSTTTQGSTPSVNSRSSKTIRKAASSSTPGLPENLPYKTGRGTNDVRVRTSDNYRRVYTDHIRTELEKEYLMSEFITAARKADLAEELKLTERQIKIWFQNRRAKNRKEIPR